MGSTTIWRSKESWYLLALAVLLIVSSVINLGYLSVVGYVLISFMILKSSPRAGFIYLVMMYYLPVLGLNVPRVFLISSLLVIVFNLKYIFSVKNYTSKTGVIVPFVIYVICMFFTGIIAVNTELYIYFMTFLIYAIIHIFICAPLLREKEDVEFCLKWWGILGALGAIVGYIHFRFQGQVYLTTLVDTNLVGKVNLGLKDADNWVRWIVAGSEPNYVGLSLIIPFSINMYYLTKKINFYNILLTFICFLGILGTFSRSSFIVSIVVILVYLLFTKGVKKTPIIIGIVGLFLLIFNVFPDFVERINSIQDNLTHSGGTGRFDRWASAATLWAQKPIIGVGLGQVSQYSLTQDVTHNTFLNILAEGGIIAFIPFVIMFLLYFKNAYVLYKTDGTELFFVTGIGYMVNLNTVSQFDYRIMLSLFILLFTQRSLTKHSRKQLI